MHRPAKSAEYPRHVYECDCPNELSIFWNFQIKISNEYYALLPGGFLGVDIFYVISGYLITFLIFERINKNSFSFADFYERRARRLLPTLFFIITISLIAGWILKSYLVVSLFGFKEVRILEAMFLVDGDSSLLNTIMVEIW